MKYWHHRKFWLVLLANEAGAFLLSAALAGGVAFVFFLFGVQQHNLEIVIAFVGLPIGLLLGYSAFCDVRNRASWWPERKSGAFPVVLKTSPEPASVFTRIIRGELPAHRVWEDDGFIAFLDISPVQPGHVLLVPKQQIDSIYDLDEATYMALWMRARQLAGPICRAMGAKRTGIVVEGLAVPHVHVHLIPVFHSNDLDPHKQRPASDAELAPVAEAIREAIAAAGVV